MSVKEYNKLLKLYADTFTGMTLKEFMIKLKAIEGVK